MVLFFDFLFGFATVILSAVIQVVFFQPTFSYL